MSNLIPPLLSSTPPPIIGPLEEDEDDEFGDFRAAVDSYDCDDLSLPPSPQKSPEKELKKEISKVNLDINSNKSQKILTATEMPIENLNGSFLSEDVEKDFQDRRKSLDDAVDQFQVNSSDSQSLTPSNITSLDNQNNEVVESNLDDEVEDSKLYQQNLELSDEQISQSENLEVPKDDDFNVQTAVPSSNNYNLNSLEDIADSTVNMNEADVTSLSNEENLFEDSESEEQKTNNSEELSELNETNEIKLEHDDSLDELSCEITDKDVEKEDESSKNLDYDNLSESSMSLKVCETDPKLSDDDFGDFEKHFAKGVTEKLQVDDEFDDFVDPPQLAQNEEKAEEQTDDDFGDFESSEFGDFSSQAYEKPVFLDVNLKNAFEKSETILKEIFPVVGTEDDNFEKLNGTDGNVIFEELKDLTETNALMYQWSKSNSQKMFLKSLNIDTRNILYGPAWNCLMPRFAANLGLTPLEPTKTEILTPIPVQNVASPSNSSQKSNGDIPTAQFDWSGSGLINPLDSTSTEPPGSVPEDSSQAQNDFFTPGLFEAEVIEKTATSGESSKVSNSQSDDFSPFHASKMVPLRETHISAEVSDKPGWLQPTIVTPDLPRREAVIDPDEDDEFDDFQMVLPEENDRSRQENNNSCSALPDLGEFDIVNKPTNNPQHIFPVLANSGPIDKPALDQPKEMIAKDDDEFTEFHSSFAPSSDILKPLRPVPVEPLKPTVQSPQPVTQINWPEPGVNEEDIKHIELTYSRRNELKPEPPQAERKLEPPTSKENPLDDDEWSDFVSVTNSVKPVLSERTSTPDLPLSVLNLNNVQAPKQPIPVITPSGLIQTKLSSNITLQPKSVVQTTLQPSSYKPPTTLFHPSIISNQFVAANSFLNNISANSQPTRNQSQEDDDDDDDDDWSDFVSGQPSSQINGYQSKPTFSQARNPQTNRTSATTNIIMNPTHFDSLQTYAPPQNKKVPSKATRNAISSISTIPDLDFIAPKSRTSRK